MAPKIVYIPQNAIFVLIMNILSLFKKPARKKGPEPKFVVDEFIPWMRFANAGMLMDGNIESMEYAIQHLPSENPVVEIGSFCGLSTNLINFFLEKNRRRNILVCSDKWEFENAGSPGTNIGGSSLSFATYKDFVRSTFLKNISYFSQGRLDKTFPIEEFSDDFFRLWKGKTTVQDVFGKTINLQGPVSFAYIDGNHTYEFAKRDYENVDVCLDVGGFILFDDSGDGSGWEVCRVIAEIKTNGRYEVVMQNPNYLMRKIK
jgi:hypothetical protein